MSLVRWIENLSVPQIALLLMAALTLSAWFVDWHDYWRYVPPPETPIDALSSMIACWRCSPHNAPVCVCTTDCGHTLCAGGWHTSLTTFTPEEVAYLRGEIEELPK